MSSVVGCPRGGGSPDNPFATEGETGKPRPSPAVADARFGPRITVVDGNLISARTPADLGPWTKALLAALEKTGN
jgi:putative intracellular protease/amidase